MCPPSSKKAKRKPTSGLSRVIWFSSRAEHLTSDGNQNCSTAVSQLPGLSQSAALPGKCAWTLAFRALLAAALVAAGTDDLDCPLPGCVLRFASAAGVFLAGQPLGKRQVQAV